MKLPYFKLAEAFNEARGSFSYGSGIDKLAATAKLLGKSVANVGMVAVEIGSEAIKKAPEIIGEQAKRQLDENGHRMSADQVSRAQELAAKGQQFKEKRLSAEREDHERHKDETQNG